MARVHGTVEIRRRTYEKEIAPENARKMLSDDFSGLCGYCGKNGQRLRQTFHVDHFVPQSVDINRKNICFKGYDFNVIKFFF